MRCAIGHAVVVHRQAQKFRTRKCDSVPTHRECESDAEAMCKCWFGVRKKGFFRSKIADLNRRQRRAGDAEKKDAMSSIVCARRLPENDAMSSIGLRLPAAAKRPLNFSSGLIPLADYVCYRRHEVMVSGAV